MPNRRGDLNGLAAALRATPSLRASVRRAAPDNKRLVPTRPERGLRPRSIGRAAQPPIRCPACAVRTGRLSTLQLHRGVGADPASLTRPIGRASGGRGAWSAPSQPRHVPSVSSNVPWCIEWDTCELVAGRAIATLGVGAALARRLSSNDSRARHHRRTDTADRALHGRRHEAVWCELPIAVRPQRASGSPQGDSRHREVSDTSAGRSCRRMWWLRYARVRLSLVPTSLMPQVHERRRAEVVRGKTA
jgi:hypothetical protein